MRISDWSSDVCSSDLQAQYFRAEILSPIRPAQAATCNPATPQVDAFDLRGIDKNLEHRPRRRQLRHFARIKLDRHIALELAVSTVLEVIGAQRRAHHRGIGAQHTVTVERRQDRKSTRLNSSH